MPDSKEAKLGKAIATATPMAALANEANRLEATVPVAGEEPSCRGA